MNPKPDWQKLAIHWEAKYKHERNAYDELNNKYQELKTNPTVVAIKEILDSDIAKAFKRLETLVEEQRNTIAELRNRIENDTR